VCVRNDTNGDLQHGYLQEHIDSAYYDTINSAGVGDFEAGEPTAGKWYKLDRSVWVPYAPDNLSNSLPVFVDAWGQRGATFTGVVNYQNPTYPYGYSVLSIFIRKGIWRYHHIRYIDNNLKWLHCIVDLDTLTTNVPDPPAGWEEGTLSSGCEDIGNGWVRVWCYGIGIGAPTSWREFVYERIILEMASSLSDFTNPFPPHSAYDVSCYVWCPMLEFNCSKSSPSSPWPIGYNPLRTEWIRSLDTLTYLCTLYTDGKLLTDFISTAPTSLNSLYNSIINCYNNLTNVNLYIGISVTARFDINDNWILTSMVPTLDNQLHTIVVLWSTSDCTLIQDGQVTDTGIGVTLYGDHQIILGSQIGLIRRMMLAHY